MRRPTNPNPPPRPPRRVPRVPALGCSPVWGIIIAVVALFFLGSFLIDLYTDSLWFNSLGYGEVFTRTLLARYGLFALGFTVAVVVLVGNWWLAWWLTRREPIFFGQEDPLDTPIIRPTIWGVGLVLAFFMGTALGGNWRDILLFLNRQPFEISDPIFGQDVGFYMFSLPVLGLLQGWLMALLLLTLTGVGALYLTARRPQLQARIFTFPRYMRLHAGALGALVALTWSLSYWLGRYGLLYSSTGVVYGPGYTDIRASLLALNALALILVVTAVLILVYAATGAWLPLIGGLIVWLLAFVGLEVIYPAIVQNYQVRPNEFTLEEPFIRNHIDGTLRAYGLDRVQSREFTPEPLTTAALVDDAVTIRNIRLWDYRPLRQTYAQLQEIRSYYDFVDVDIDRYSFPNDPDGIQQVTVSARELSSSQLQNRTWVNTHLEFTHGYGVVMSPVTEVTPQGYPRFYIQNLPPVATIPITFTNPAIYYGEATDQYVLVKTALPEFDYPIGDTNAQVIYQGTGGISVGSFINRLAFALRLGDSQLFFTNALTPESRIKLNRQIHQRVRLIAPFLQYDADPYIIIHDGRLWWMHDAYTTSNSYPYSRPFVLNRADGQRLGPLNYIRNSVKIVTDAYNGAVTYYVADPNDPLIRAWQGVFPSLFRPIEEMPAGLRGHVRYPVDLFQIQADVYATYHMTDPRVFYNREDLWAIPQELVGNQRVPVEPYYVVMRLLDETQPEFLLIQPFSPARKDNMIAWMAARSDAPHYGQLIAYNFPKQENIQGPLQIEARIDQDPVISQQLSLWNQRGSSVIRGNLLVIPIGKSLLYVEPIYLQAESGQIPQLQRVVLASQDRTPIMRETLAQALEPWNASAILDGAPQPAQPTPPTAGQPPPTAGQPTTPTTRSLNDVARSAQARYQAAQEAIRVGDWARYGRELEALQRELEELVRLTGQQ